jgi:hypothetical protein
MTDDPTRHFRRWREADETGRDEEADAACRAMFNTIVRGSAVSPDFMARTLTSIAAATAADAARVRRTRRATIAGGVAAAGVAVYVGGGWFLSVLSAGMVGVINLLVGATVRVAAGLQAGVDVWAILASLGRAAAAIVSDPAVTIAIVGMQGVAMAALIALQRLLGSDRESLK